jgi:hypothetical protein
VAMVTTVGAAAAGALEARIAAPPRATVETAAVTTVTIRLAADEPGFIIPGLDSRVWGGHNLRVAWEY